MPGIVQRRRNQQQGIVSSPNKGGGGVARRNNNGNNRNNNRGRGNSGSNGSRNPPPPGDGLSLLNSNANKDPASGWSRFWGDQGVGLGTTDAFSNWMNNGYYNEAHQKFLAAGLNTTGNSWLDWLGKNYSAQRARNDWMSQTPMTQQLVGSGQARWQFF